MSQLNKDDQLKVNNDECIEMMRSRSARNFLYRHMQTISLDVDTFNPDPYIHARYAGMRAAGILLRETLKRCAPEEYKQMLREQQ
jgi:hypothetical protein